MITESKAGHAATRNMNCCAVTGQDTGIAAALSLKTNKALERIDIAQLQAVLDQQGVRFT
ncbi:MAG: FAD-dependent oxidoreductase [Gammaproteobacteria bacterium]